MDDRYPYLRFVIDAAQVIAAAVAATVFLSGTVHSCHHGGGQGFLAFLLSIGVAVIAYVVVMVKIEVLRVLLDIERSTRQAHSAPRAEPPSGTPASM